jgi:hypothetical protein
VRTLRTLPRLNPVRNQPLMTVKTPKHPLYALTTYELTDYRRELEHALAVLPRYTADREDLLRRLADVTGEQESRAAIAAAPTRTPGSEGPS